MYVVYVEAPKGERPLERPFKAFSADRRQSFFQATRSVMTRNERSSLRLQTRTMRGQRSLPSRWAKVNLSEQSASVFRRRRGARETASGNVLKNLALMQRLSFWV